MLNQIPKSSLDIKKEQIQKLKSIFPEVVTEGKVDFEKLQATLGEDSLADRDSYKLTWAGKENVFKVIQKQSWARLAPCRDESIDFDNSENLFIEGENLEVLKLLQKSYSNKIKMIYIDPPYNTGNDFIYEDDYTDGIKNYLRQTGQIDEDGNYLKTNTETSGRFHSNWLNMMYPRLFLARQLLREDGVIAISIDYHEYHNLRIIMNELFGEENYVETLVWRRKSGGGQQDDYFVTEHEYILIYAKNKTNFKLYEKKIKKDKSKYRQHFDKEKNRYYRTVKLAKWGTAPYKEDRPTMYFPIIDPDGNNNYPVAPDGRDGRWRYGKATVMKMVENNDIHWERKNGQWVPYEKEYEPQDDEYRILKERSILFDLVENTAGTNELTNIFNVKDIFPNPKPTDLLSHLLILMTNPNSNDIILDFFAGSCTLAHSVIKQNQADGGNRKFIMVELPKKLDKDTIAYKEGYNYISEISKERIKRVITGYGDNPQPIDTGFKVFKLTSSVFSQWKSPEDEDIDELKQQLKLFDNIIDDNATKEDVFYEILLKKGFDLNSIINKLNIYSNKVYEVINRSENQNKFYICLDEKINDKTFEELNLTEENSFICPDTSLTDEQKINLSMQTRLEVI